MAYTVPSAYQTGFNNNYQVLYIVRVHPNGSSPWYFYNGTSSPKSIGLPRAITYDGAALSDGTLSPEVPGLHNGFLLSEVMGSPMAGIGEIDHSISFSGTGGLAGRSECVIQLIDDYTLVALWAKYTLEYSPIEVWQGYMIPGAGTMTIESDFMLLFKGVVKDMENPEPYRIVLNCVDSRDVTDKMMGRRIINLADSDFQYAPEESVGEPLPLLFGDFSTANTATYGTHSLAPYEVEFRSLNLAPTIAAHNSNNQLYLHDDDDWTMGGSDYLYTVSKDLDWVGVVNSADVATAADSASSNYLVFSRGSTGAKFFGWPRQRGPSWSGITAGDVGNLFDKNLTGNNVVVGGGQTLALAFNDFDDPGWPMPRAVPVPAGNDGHFALYSWVLGISAKTVTGTVGVKIKDWQSGETGPYLIRKVSDGSYTVQSNAVTKFHFNLPQFPANEESFNQLKQSEFLIIVEAGGGATIESVWVEGRFYPRLRKEIIGTGPRRTGNRGRG